VFKVSIRKHLRKEASARGKFYRKNSAALIEWHANAEEGEEISSSN